MKRLRLITKTLLVAAGLCVGMSAWADCSVTTDSYGKTKVVWDFTIIESKQSTAGDYYLDALNNCYVNNGYLGSAPTSINTASYIAKINIYGGDSRCILPAGSPDSDKGAGVLLGISGNTWQGYLEFYAPISGKITVTGNYAGRITITDKSNSDTKLYTGNSSDSKNAGQSITTTTSAVRGHRYQLNATGGMGVASITITADDFDTDVVGDGNMTFNDATNSVYGVGVDPYSSESGATNLYQFSSKGFKSVTSVTAVTDCIVLQPGASNSIIINPSGEAYGLKVRANNSKGMFNYTTTKNGYLTLALNYGSGKGKWYIKDPSSNTTIKEVSGTGPVYLTAGQRAQYVNNDGSNAVLITGITFTEVTSVSATIGSNGYTTFSSPYPLALGSMTASTGDVTAYYATAVGGSSVTLTSIAENVEAGEGLILKGTAGATFTIPVAVSGSAISNYLVGCPTATELTTPNDNYYVMVNSGENVEFQALNGSYTDNKVTIPAGKAYLNVSAANARLSVVFNDDETTTGIDDVRSKMSDVRSEYYNLNGQRIEKPSKGLYIVNGKKVILK